MRYLWSSCPRATRTIKYAFNNTLHFPIRYYPSVHRVVYAFDKLILSARLAGQLDTGVSFVFNQRRIRSCRSKFIFNQYRIRRRIKFVTHEATYPKCTNDPLHIMLSRLKKNTTDKTKI